MIVCQKKCGYDAQNHMSLPFFFVHDNYRNFMCTKICHR